MKKINNSKKTGAVVGVAVLAAVLIGVSVSGMEKKSGKQNNGVMASQTEQYVLENQTELMKEDADDKNSTDKNQSQAAQKSSAEDSTVLKETESKESGLTAEQALAAALKDAGLSKNEVTVIKNEKEYDDGQNVYDIEFMTADLEYSYEILVSDGTIVSSDREKPDDDDVQKKSQNGDSTGKNENKNSDIGIEKAKSIALKHAGVSGKVQYKKAKLEREDGRFVYEIEFDQGEMEYEYEILASDGTILDWSAERDDDD